MMAIAMWLVGFIREMKFIEKNIQAQVRIYTTVNFYFFKRDFLKSLFFTEKMINE